jgi:hypothetical protein
MNFHPPIFLSVIRSCLQNQAHPCLCNPLVIPGKFVWQAVNHQVHPVLSGHLPSPIGHSVKNSGSLFLWYIGQLTIQVFGDMPLRCYHGQASLGYHDPPEDAPAESK